MLIKQDLEPVTKSHVAQAKKFLAGESESPFKVSAREEKKVASSLRNSLSFWALGVDAGTTESTLQVGSGIILHTNGSSEGKKISP